jgi:hypothetical protein
MTHTWLTKFILSKKVEIFADFRTIEIAESDDDRLVDRDSDRIPKTQISER